MIAVFSILLYLSTFSLELTHKPFVIAHKGASGHLPENTLESFAVGINSYTDFIELDVVLTKENDTLVMHDPFLSRITDIESHPEFATRKRERQFDNKTKLDW